MQPYHDETSPTWPRSPGHASDERRPAEGKRDWKTWPPANRVVFFFFFFALGMKIELGSSGTAEPTFPPTTGAARGAKGSRP